ncbi:MAG: DUF2950 domain-containing protein [Acetobacteraceae bacterium]
MTRLTIVLRTLCLVSVLLAAIPGQAAEQATFASAEDAAKALVTVLRGGDPAQIQAVLGPGSEKLISSGDKYADAEARRKFVEAYQASHKLTEAEPGRMVLDVGADDWPLPIPIVQANGKWRFDSVAGAQELVNRRIGQNELSAIRTCLAYAEAQAGYRVLSGAANGGNWQYAQKLISTKGRRDGLYWPASVDSADASPLAAVIADAQQAGYPVDFSSGKRMPYHGYFFRILKAQGPNAPGGAKSYMVNGRMTQGYGLIAWPASYGVSGVMTFIVNQDSTVYQKDLGPDTAKIAGAIMQFDPDISWARVDIVNQ